MVVKWPSLAAKTEKFFASEEKKFCRIDSKFIFFEVSFMKLLDVEICNHYFGVKDIFFEEERNTIGFDRIYTPSKTFTYHPD